MKCIGRYDYLGIQNNRRNDKYDNRIGLLLVNCIDTLQLDNEKQVNSHMIENQVIELATLAAYEFIDLGVFSWNMQFNILGRAPEDDGNLLLRWFLAAGKCSGPHG